MSVIIARGLVVPRRSCRAYVKKRRSNSVFLPTEHRRGRNDLPGQKAIKKAAKEIKEMPVLLPITELRIKS